MHLIIALLFRGPFWIQFALAAGLAWLGWTVQQQDLTQAAARAALINQTPPATISVTEFSTEAASNVPVELSLTALVALDHNTRLITKTNFIKTGEDLFYVLVDPADGADITVAQAGIVIDPDQLDAFTEWLLQNTTDFAAAGPIATISGLRTSQSNSSHAYDAMKNQGMTVAPDFFFIEPFTAGRAATLSALPAKDMQLSWVFYGFAALMALVGLKKLKDGNRRPTLPAVANRSPAANTVASQSLAAMQAIQPLPPAKPTVPIRPPMSKGRIFTLVLGAAFVLALFTGQSWAYAILPLGCLGLMFLGLRNGMRTARDQLGAVIDHFGAKPAPSNADPSATVAARTAKGVPKDSGPIRSGFSFKDLLPQPKQKSAPRPDPFERLAQQRQRQNAGSPGR